MQARSIPQMLREHGVTRLWNIQSADNLKSILEYGILCRSLVDERGIEHKDISNREVSDRRGPRRRVSVRGWYFSPHQYVPLFLSDGTPMLYVSVRDHSDSIVLLELDLEVSATPKTLYTDGNLASHVTQIFDDALYSNQLDWPTILFGDGADWSEKRKKSAEVLIPDRIEPRFILGIHLLRSCREEKLSRIRLIVQESGRDDIAVSQDLYCDGLSR